MRQFTSPANAAENDLLFCESVGLFKQTGGFFYWLNRVGRADGR